MGRYPWDHLIWGHYGVIIWGPYLGSQDPIMVYPIMPSGEACSYGIPGSLIWYPWITIWGTPYGVIMGSLWGPQMGPYLGSQDPIMVYPIMPSGEACSSGIPGSLIWYPWITSWDTPYDLIWGHYGVLRWVHIWGLRTPLWYIP